MVIFSGFCDPSVSQSCLVVLNLIYSDVLRIVKARSIHRCGRAYIVHRLIAAINRLLPP